MANTLIRDHHNLRRNLNLNDKYISNDGGDEGIRVTDAGLVGIGVADPDTQLEVFGTSMQLKLSYDGSNYTEASIAADGELHIETYGTDADMFLEAKGDVYIEAHAGDVFLSDSGGMGTGSFMFDVTGDPNLTIRSDVDGGDTFKLQVNDSAATEISTVDSDAAVAHLKFDIDGHVEFEGCGVGFDLVTPTYDATDTVVDFKTGNKQFVTFGSGNITNIQFHFPATSGNFVCLLKQDGTGSRTITNYKAFDSAGNAAAGAAAPLFAGGSNPTLTTDANHVDIVSIFWDADNEIAYAVPSLDFQF